MRRAWLLALAVLLQTAQARAAGTSVSIVFERQVGRAANGAPAAPVKRTLGIAWDERARAGGQTAVFARSVTVTYSLAPGLSISKEEAAALERTLSETLSRGLPSVENPALLPSDDDALFDYRQASADRLMRLVDARGLRLASAARLDLPPQAVVVLP
jgi:hypothetical protein